MVHYPSYCFLLNSSLSCLSPSVLVCSLKSRFSNISTKARSSFQYTCQHITTWLCCMLNSHFTEDQCPSYKNYSHNWQAQQKESDLPLIYLGRGVWNVHKRKHNDLKCKVFRIFLQTSKWAHFVEYFATFAIAFTNRGSFPSENETIFSAQQKYPNPDKKMVLTFKIQKSTLKIWNIGIFPMWKKNNSWSNVMDKSSLKGAKWPERHEKKNHAKMSSRTFADLSTKSFCRTSLGHIGWTALVKLSVTACAIALL